MAVLSVGQAVLAYSDGVLDRTCLVEVKNTTAGDTLDLGASGILPLYSYIKLAGLVSATGTTIAGVSISAPTGLTIPAGPSNDGVWLLIRGVSL